MKKSIYVLVAGMFLLTGCMSHDFDEVTPAEKETTQDEIDQNLKKVFGVEFNPNHDWKLTTQGKLTFNVTPSVKKVQVVAYTEYVDENGENRTKMGTLTQTDVNNRSSITLSYNAPMGDNVSLYAAFVTDESYYQTKIEGSTVSFADVKKARTRAGENEFVTNYTLPGGKDQTYSGLTSIISYANERGWVPGELLYQLPDEAYDAMRMEVPGTEQYSTDFVQNFWLMENTFFPNQEDNRQRVIDTGLYNEGVYPLTTGNAPVIVSPVYKHDSAKKYGNEVYNSDLYYYYFKKDVINTMSDAQQVEFIKSLPKYKAIAFNKVFKVDKDTQEGELDKNAAYALLYFGDTDKPTANTTGSYIFPKDVYIGFMVRTKTDYEKPKKQGEVYGDGRLNDKINNFGNFASSGLASNDPRVAWLVINGKNFLTWETGTDADYNDIVIEIQGVKVPPIIPEYPEVYTYCFEDRNLGDYDLNDVVITATRKEAGIVEYVIEACGAHDELYVMGIDPEWDNTEVHALFGKETTDFINTDPNQDYINPRNITKLVITKDVSETNFYFGDENTDPYIRNKSQNREVRIAKKGKNPNAILIPGEFLYPIEKVCVKNAYKGFNDWGVNILSNGWYLNPVKSKVYTKKPKNN